MTANRWLVLYSPKEDKLYTPEEAQQALVALFEKVKNKRRKAYAWEPEGWTPILERRYQKWLSLENVLETVEQKGYEQAELFSREYLNLLAHQLEDDPTPDEILHFDALCNEYASKIDGSIKVEKPMTIVQMVEKAVSILDKEEQSKVMKSVVVVLNDLSIHMENEK